MSPDSENWQSPCHSCISRDSIHKKVAGVKKAQPPSSCALYCTRHEELEPAHLLGVACAGQFRFLDRLMMHSHPLKIYEEVKTPTLMSGRSILSGQAVKANLASQVPRVRTEEGRPE
jgi:hypothetical protein